MREKICFRAFHVDFALIETGHNSVTSMVPFQIVVKESKSRTRDDDKVTMAIDLLQLTPAGVLVSISYITTEYTYKSLCTGGGSERVLGEG